MSRSMETPASKVGYPDIEWRRETFHKTILERTQRIYDLVANIYPASTFFFHSKAHRAALEMSGIKDGMRILEVATGSGEMFRRLVRANRGGQTIGIDLSARMAARTQHTTRKMFPGSETHCQAVDARQLPFADGSFDAVVCCFMLELLAEEDIHRTIQEFRRVLRSRGRLTLVLIGQNTEMFNRVYRVAGWLAPAFWGRQVEQRVPGWIKSCGFRILGDRTVRQTFYPSRVLAAKK